ncbi:MAG TPA: small, acid-soluble spore protein, alpha/beta type [Clostridiaceae bacterium]|nr:small, acid-soluble spore protein, alpha/beta type [Clostridiaceae bacterium]
MVNKQDLYNSDRKGVSKRFTQEIASEVGVQLSDYNPDLKARDAGRIGGRITQRLVEAGKSQLGE